MKIVGLQMKERTEIFKKTLTTNTDKVMDIKPNPMPIPNQGFRYLYENILHTSHDSCCIYAEAK